MGELLGPLAQRSAEQPALLDETGETSWKDFDQRVNQLIHALRAAGVASGDTIAILSGNRREYYEVMAAGSQAGWSYVPINWHWVAEEVGYVLENSGAVALLVEARYAEIAAQAVAAAGASVLCPEVCPRWPANISRGPESPQGAGTRRDARADKRHLRWWCRLCC